MNLPPSSHHICWTMVLLMKRRPGCISIILTVAALALVQSSSALVYPHRRPPTISSPISHVQKVRNHALNPSTFDSRGQHIQYHGVPRRHTVCLTTKEGSSDDSIVSYCMVCLVCIVYTIYRRSQLNLFAKISHVYPLSY